MGAQGVSALPLLVVEHPLGGERPEAIARRAQQAFEQLNAIVAGSARPAQAVGGLSETARAPHAESTDPMTVADDPMAVVVAAVEAMLDRAFNLYGVQATTHPVAPLLVVNGPYGRELGMHGGSGCFGPGFRANATIGRAVRLILLNVGGAWPGRYDMATQGSPAKFSYCIAENDAGSPWGPMATGDTVTVYGGEPPHNVNDHVSTTASGILTTLCDTAVSLGSNVGWYFSQSQLLVVLGPEHAKTVADDGFTRADVQRFVYEHARLSLGHLRLGGMWGMHDWPGWMNAVTDPAALMPQVPSPDDVYVVIAGGSGKHSAVVPNCTFSRAVSRPIRAGHD